MGGRYAVGGGALFADCRALRVVHALGVYGDHYALRAEECGRFGYERGVGDGGGVERRLVRARFQHAAHIGHGSQSAAHGQRYEHLLRY